MEQQQLKLKLSILVDVYYLWVMMKTFTRGNLSLGFHSAEMNNYLGTALKQVNIGPTETQNCGKKREIAREGLKKRQKDRRKTKVYKIARGEMRSNPLQPMVTPKEEERQKMVFKCDMDC